MRTVNPVKYASQVDRILEAAAGLFSTKGYRETGMKEIAEACGLTKASLYHYFDGKDALFLSLLNRRIEGLQLGSREVWRADSLRAALEGAAQEYFDVVDRTNAHEVLALLLTEGEKRQEVGDLLQKLGRQYEEDFLEGAVGHGLIRPGDEEKLRPALYAFFGSLAHYNMDRIFFGKSALRMTREKYAKYVSAVMAAGWSDPGACAELQAAPMARPLLLDRALPAGGGA